MITFAIDFDGTCVDHQYPYIGDDVPGAASTLLKLAAEGNRLILNTMRNDRALQLTLNWFSFHDIPLYGINENPEQKEWTNSPKVYANYYIDDSAIGCPLIHPDGFERACVDWEIINVLLEKS